MWRGWALPLRYRIPFLAVLIGGVVATQGHPVALLIVAVVGIFLRFYLDATWRDLRPPSADRPSWWERGEPLPLLLRYGLALAAVLIAVLIAVASSDLIPSFVVGVVVLALVLIGDAVWRWFHPRTRTPSADRRTRPLVPYR